MSDAEWGNKRVRSGDARREKDPNPAAGNLSISLHVHVYRMYESLTQGADA